MKFLILAIFSSVHSLKLSGDPPKCEYKARESSAPPHFSGPNDDRLMWSTIEQYSMEEFCDGKATGKFFVDKNGIQAMAREVVNTHVKP